MRETLLFFLLLGLLTAPSTTRPHAREEPKSVEEAITPEKATNLVHSFRSLRLAIKDLIGTYGSEYALGQEYLDRLDRIEKRSPLADHDIQEMARLQREALFSNPLLESKTVLVVKRAVRSWNDWENLGLPSNHECNSSLKRTGYDNEIAVLYSIDPNPEWKTLYRPENDGYVGEIDLHWGTDKILFTQADSTNWKVWERELDGSSLRQVSRAPEDMDCFDPCYLPDGRILFGSTASYQSVPCWHGQRWVSNLYAMDADGSNVRQICFDQDHNFHPSVLNNGQVVYHRWDYTGVHHVYQRQLMAMNPDGTRQRAIYGSNSWFPNALYFPRPLPNDSGKIVSILSGYHGVHRMGQLVLVDLEKGVSGAEGLSLRISGKGDPINPIIRDQLVDQDWPKFLHPYPLSDKHFLVSCCPSPESNWGIYLADVYDNLLLVTETPGYALLEPVPLVKRPIPLCIPETIRPDAEEATVYLHDVYAGPGLKGVPKGTLKGLRVLAYHFGYRGLAGPDKIGYGGPWEVMRILGTVPLEEDGSALFQVPARTPIALQPLDAEGKAIQLMRSWMTAMPGEYLSCVGCHEPPGTVPELKPTQALGKNPQEILPWYGPARGFDFEREVQPVLDVHCVSCHNHDHPEGLDLRSEGDGVALKTWPVGYPERMHPAMREDTGGRVRFTPAYDVLLRYIRRVGVEDDVSLLLPGEYHADTSELIQMLQAGHHGVQLDWEAWDRLVTWIDLNGPCHGTWGEVYPIPDGAHERRMELRRLYGGPKADPETIPELERNTIVAQAMTTDPQFPAASSMKHFSAPDRPKGTPAATPPPTESIDLGKGTLLRLVRVPAGAFDGKARSGTPVDVSTQKAPIDQPFLMSVCEISNAQFRLFDPNHDSGYYAKRHATQDDRGLTLNEPEQPAVRVSWEQAAAYCQWLSERAGRPFRLPTADEWEHACRAGGDSPLYDGGIETDLSNWANVADQEFARGNGGVQQSGGLPHFFLEGADLADGRFSDGSVVTAAVGSYRPNAWGLYDMQGNVWEWTTSERRSLPGQVEPDFAEDALREKIVLGGSFFDRPERCQASVKVSYPEWQGVFNVGFRVIATED